MSPNPIQISNLQIACHKMYSRRYAWSRCQRQQSLNFQLKADQAHRLKDNQHRRVQGHHYSLKFERCHRNGASILLLRTSLTGPFCWWRAFASESIVPKAQSTVQPWRLRIALIRIRHAGLNSGLDARLPRKHRDWTYPVDHGKDLCREPKHDNQQGHE